MHSPPGTQACSRTRQARSGAPTTSCTVQLSTPAAVTSTRRALTRLLQTGRCGSAFVSSPGAARGLLAEILSRPDDWDTTADEIWERAKSERGEAAGEGRDMIRDLFAELEAAGYLRRVKKRGPRGRMFTELHVYDVPAGRTDDETSRRRSEQGKQAIAAGRTDDETSRRA